MHEDLSTPERAVGRLVHDTLVHLVRKPGQLELVRVGIGAGWDPAAFGAAMEEAYAARGILGVRVVVLPTAGDPRLLSVVLAG